MRILELTEVRSDKTIVKNIMHVNPAASDSDCATAAIALNSLSNNRLKSLKRVDVTDIKLGGD